MASESSSQTSEEPGVTFVLGDSVTEPEKERADRMVRTLAAQASRPVIFARLKLTYDESRPPDEHAIAQGTLDMSGALIRGQVAAPTMTEAIDVLGSRLGRSMRRIAEQRVDAGQRPSSTPDGQWRSGDLPSTRPTHFGLPMDERSIVRRKSFAPGSSSVEEAMFDLDVLDHRFFLFTDEDDGHDSVVFETDDGVTLRRLDGGEPLGMERLERVNVDPTPATTLSDTDAQDRLDLSGSPFIFFRRAETGRGAVLYRRYDGHYGLVEPSG